MSASPKQPVTPRRKISGMLGLTKKKDQEETRLVFSFDDETSAGRARDLANSPSSLSLASPPPAISVTRAESLAMDVEPQPPTAMSTLSEASEPPAVLAFADERQSAPVAGVTLEDSEDSGITVRE